MDDICLVTAFIDINRDNWYAFRRSQDEYIARFSNYIKIYNTLIVYIDDKYYSRLQNICSNYPHITLIPINKSWLNENIFAYSLLEKENEIMNSDEFKNLISHRIHHPECCKAEYNIIQHAKIDFIIDTIKNNYSTAEYYAWSDFGYLINDYALPTSYLDLKKFNRSKINFCGINPLKDMYNDVFYIVKNAPDLLGGGFFFGHKDKLYEYQEMYHDICKYFHSLNIVDDDQHIMLQCIFKNPKMFHIHYLGGWFNAFRTFSK